MPTSSGSRKRSTRRGASAVEFALVAPTFFMLILGIIAFGRMMMVQEVLVNAARAGARAAIASGATDASVATVISNCMSAAGISGLRQLTLLLANARLGPGIRHGPDRDRHRAVRNVGWVNYGSWFQGQTLTGTAIMIKE